MIVAFAVAVGPAWAWQLAAGPAVVAPGLRADLPGPGAADGRDVYVDDSFEAADAVSRARAFARAGRWSPAARLLDGAIEKYADKLIEVGDGRYVGLREHVRNLIADWPVAGVAVYRRLFEADARRALVEAQRRDDPRALLLAYDRYFSTRAVIEAVDRMAQRAIERGNGPLARWLYATALARHPDRQAYAPLLTGRLAIVEAMAGRADAANAYAERASQLDGAGAVRWMGRDEPIDRVVADIVQSFETTHPPQSSPDWPVFGGDPTRDRTGDCAVQTPGLLWRFDKLPRSQDEILIPGQGDLFTRHRLPVRAEGLIIHPVVAADKVVIQSGPTILALNLRSGTQIWRAGERLDTSVFDDDMTGPTWDAPTIHDGRVYTAITRQVAMGYGFEIQETSSTLVCLDLDTGDMIWETSGKALGGEHAEVVFDSSPLVTRGRTMIIGRRRRAFGFEDCYLYRFRSTDGVFLGRTHMGSASTGSFGFRRTTTTIASLADDVVYACSNLGTLAALSADTGVVRWLMMYDRSASRTRVGVRSAQNAKPWGFNAALVAAGRLICLPSDADDILVLDADTGTIQRRIAREDLGDVETLLGVTGDVLVTSGKRVCAFDLAEGRSLWCGDLPDGAAPVGRGVLLDDRALVPTQDALSSFLLCDGTREDHAWDMDGAGGNLVALPDMLLVAGDGTVGAYLRKEDIWNNLRERMNRARDDPKPALDLAEVAFRDGEMSEAVTALSEAVRRAEATPRDDDPALDGRIFSDAMRFAARLAVAESPDTTALDVLFDHASRFAPDARAHVDYRLRFGKWFDQTGQTPRAVRLYQQILMDRSLRPVSATFENGQTETAAAVAKRRIGKLIERRGPNVYAPFEQQAQRLLQAGSGAQDAATLERVVTSYPNAEAAPKALLTLGDLAIEQHRPIEAARQFIRVYYEYPRHANRPELMRRIADAYLAVGQRRKAYGWLTRAAREFPGLRLSYNDGPLTFLEYRAQIARAGTAVEPSRPDIRLPLAPTWSRTFPNSPVLLKPRFAEQGSSDWSCAWVYEQQRVLAVDRDTGEPLWKDPPRIRPTPTVLVAGNDRVVLATPYQVLGLDRATGHVDYTIGSFPKQIEQAERDWEGKPMFKSFALNNGRLIIVRDDGQTTCLTIGDGRRLWQRFLTPQPAGPIVATDDWLLYTTLVDHRPYAVLLDWSDGSERGRFRLQNLGPILRRFVSLDGQLIVVQADRVAAYDPQTGRQRWLATPGGRIRESSLVLDVDGLYLSNDGRHILKLDLGDGHELWRTSKLTPRPDEGLELFLLNDSLVVTDARIVKALDAVNGQMLWEGMTDRPRFAFRRVTSAYIAAIDLRPEPDDDENTPAPTPRIFFFDYRNASGLIPQNGGVLELSTIQPAGKPDGPETTEPATPPINVDDVVFLDSAVIIRDGNTLHAWTHP